LLLAGGIMPRMATSELIVWSCMLGGFLTLAMVAVSDLAINPTVGAWRALVFVLLTGWSCVIMSGLAGQLFPDIPELTMEVMKVSMAPLSGALALTYLGFWLGVKRDDRAVYRSMVFVSMGLILTSVVATACVLYGSDPRDTSPLLVTGMLSVVGALVGLVITIRAALLGDDLARWMVLACLFLVAMVVGMFGQALSPGVLGWPLMALIAFCTLCHFLLITALTVQRNRVNKQLIRLTKKASGTDPATGLHTGSVLVSKVDDAFWRSARLSRECAVVCLHLGNLYELGESVGHGVEQQILQAMTARIRRAVGFRYVVGLYHPRCFVVVISAVKKEQEVERMVLRLRTVLDRPLKILGLKDASHTFQPRFGFGIAHKNAADTDPTAVMDLAERRALAQSGVMRVPEESAPTAAGAL
jgi:GGDEF domain-containing protein